MSQTLIFDQVKTILISEEYYLDDSEEHLLNQAILSGEVERRNPLDILRYIKNQLDVDGELKDYHTLKIEVQNMKELV